MKPRHPLLRRLWRIALVLFPLLVAALLVRAARAVDWEQVLETLAGYAPGTLVVAAALTLASYAIYCAYDLAARTYAHHHLPTRRVVLIAFICYALSLNIGALVGGAGFRFRLYSRAGLGAVTISRVIAFSVTTNWLGYTLLAGVLFATGAIEPPAAWGVGASVHVLGGVMLAAVAAYLLACHLSHGRVFHVRGHHFRLPSPALGLVQFALSGVNWCVMALILQVLLPDGLSYPTVLGVLLLGAIASAMAHIPAGIGVLEAVFVAVLGHVVPPAQLVAALLAYRAVYYLAPLLAAVALYVFVEARGAPRPVRADAGGA